MLLTQASQNPTEENRCLFHNYIFEGARRAGILSEMVAELKKDDRCTKYGYPHFSKESFSLLLENAINDLSEKNVCLFHRYMESSTKHSSEKG